jgi:hypothetical protein
VPLTLMVTNLQHLAFQDGTGIIFVLIQIGNDPSKILVVDS